MTEQLRNMKRKEKTVTEAQIACVLIPYDL